MKKIVIFRINGSFTMLEVKKWNKKRNRFSQEVQETARVKSISDSAFNQMSEFATTREAQLYFKTVWNER